MKLIVSRHPAVPEFVRKRLPEFADAVVLTEVTPDQVQGNEVVGNLPAGLAALAARYIAVEFPPGRAPRGQEYSLRDMEEAGARLVEYQVRCVREY